MSIQLLSAVTATNSPPTAATDGVDVKASGILRDEAYVLVKSTDGSGTMTVTVKLWGWYDTVSAWAPLGIGSTKGVLNDGTAIAEETADNIVHVESLSGLTQLQRVYAEITAIGGTSTAIDVFLV